jgi:hypothetical protein
VKNNQLPVRLKKNGSNFWLLIEKAEVKNKEKRSLSILE